jgi:ribosomal protein S18 acetylase RimI-like enzyme
MRLTAREKDSDMFERLLRINDESFNLDERASREKFKALFDANAVYVDSALTPAAFAIVTDRGGPYVIVIAVTSSLRGQGVGSALLREIAEYSRACGEYGVALMCKIDNWQAQRLYLKNEYRVVRVVPGYYGATDGLLMRRKI